MSEGVGRGAQQPFPSDIDSDEKKRRWELVTRAVLITYGWNPDDPAEVLDSRDRAFLMRAVRASYESDVGTGEGSITDEQRKAMRAMGAL